MADEDEDQEGASKTFLQYKICRMKDSKELDVGSSVKVTISQIVINQGNLLMYAKLN